MTPSLGTNQRYRHACKVQLLCVMLELGLRCCYRAIEMHKLITNGNCTALLTRGDTSQIQSNNPASGDM